MQTRRAYDRQVCGQAALPAEVTQLGVIVGGDAQEDLRSQVFDILGRNNTLRR